MNGAVSPHVRPGLEDAPKALARFAGRPLGLILHPASVTSDLRFAADWLLDAGVRLDALFGPQHGARGEKQDNMIESDHYTDPVTGLPVHSLYSEVRKPTPEMLAGLDGLVFDLQDVGVRVYTFVWTMALAMEACAKTKWFPRAADNVMTVLWLALLTVWPILLESILTICSLQLWFSANSRISI